MEDWKDLDIENFDMKFFTDGLEVRYYDAFTHEHQLLGVLSFRKKIELIHKTSDFDLYKISYRLKPLEPIRVTGQILTDLDNYLNRNYHKTGVMRDVAKYYGRKVEVIE